MCRPTAAVVLRTAMVSMAVHTHLHYALGDRASAAGDKRQLLFFATEVRFVELGDPLELLNVRFAVSTSDRLQRLWNA